jgi:hypothetical protein
MATLNLTLNGARNLFGSSLKSLRRNPRKSAAVALSAVAGVALAGGIARRFRSHRHDRVQPEKKARRRGPGSFRKSAVAS